MFEKKTCKRLEQSLAVTAISRAVASLEASHEFAALWNSVPIFSPLRTLIILSGSKPLHIVTELELELCLK
jgi:hypothetical protein